MFRDFPLQLFILLRYVMRSLFLLRSSFLFVTSPGEGFQVQVWSDLFYNNVRWSTVSSNDQMSGFRPSFVGTHQVRSTSTTRLYVRTSPSTPRGQICSPDLPGHWHNPLEDLCLDPTSLIFSSPSTTPSHTRPTDFTSQTLVVLSGPAPQSFPDT